MGMGFGGGASGTLRINREIMRYKFSGLKLNIGFTQEELLRKLNDETHSKCADIRILRLSVDARNKGNIHYVANVAFSAENRLNYDVYYETHSNIRQLSDSIGNVSGRAKVAVVGSGPCGMFCAMTLASCGVNVDVYERGESIDKRQKSVLDFKINNHLNSASNIQFGEGGAGTFSDGKLNTGVNSEYISVVLGEFVACGADDDIQYMAKPHIGTDVLAKVVVNMRNKLIALGGTISFESFVEDIVVADGKVKGIVVKGKSIAYDYVVLACGHSARDSYTMLYSRGVNMERKPFAIGARIEHNQSLINIAQYGRDDRSLPPAEYKLSQRLKSGRTCFTFCMCPGGEIVPAGTETNAVVTNGMSNRLRDGKYANSAILVSVEPNDYGDGGVLAGVEYQRRYERAAYELSGGYAAPAITVKDYINKSINPINLNGCVDTSYAQGIRTADISKCLPTYVSEGMREGIIAFGGKIRGFDREGILLGVETRSSAPVRVLRDDNFNSNIVNLIPGGEGAGYAGGITSAALDGLKIAINLINRLK